MKINAIPPKHCVYVNTLNSLYLVEKLKKPGRIKVSIVATCHFQQVLDDPWRLEPQVCTYMGLVHPTWGLINGCELKKVGVCGFSFQVDGMGFHGVTVTSEILNVTEKPIHISALRTEAENGWTIEFRPGSRTFACHTM